MLRLSALFALSTLLVGVSAFGQITLGQVDDFQDGTTQNWESGGPNPTPPIQVPTGGPTGAGDGYLRIQASGGFGPGSKPAFFNRVQWTGDWTAAGVTLVTLDVRNDGPNPVDLRMRLNGNGGTAVSNNAVTVPAGSGWTSISFPTTAADLTGSDVALTLTSVFEAWFFHNSFGAFFPGPALQADLCFDNVMATQPVECWLMAGIAQLNAPLSPGGLDPMLVNPLMTWPIDLFNVPSFYIPPGSEGFTLYFQTVMWNLQAFPTDPLKLSSGLAVTVGTTPVHYGTQSGMRLRWQNDPIPGTTFRIAFDIL